MWVVLPIVCPVAKSVGSSFGTTRTGEELEYKTTASEESLVKEIPVKSKSGLSKHPTQLVKYSLIGKGVPKYILLGVLKASIPSIITNAGKRRLPGEVILLPLVSITQHTVGLIYFLKLFLGLLFVTGISIWMVFKGKCSKGFFNIFLAGIIRNTKNSVVVFHNLAS